MMTEAVMMMILLKILYPSGEIEKIMYSQIIQEIINATIEFPPKMRKNIIVKAKVPTTSSQMFNLSSSRPNLLAR